MSKKIGVLVGSLRRESFSRKIAKFMITLAPAGFILEEVDMSDLPIYNQDFDDDNNPPQAYTIFREKLQSFDGFLFVTPEYNRSVTAVLKNALDVGSRPYGQSRWDAKPSGIISVSVGNMGGFGANHHLRQSIAFLNMPLLQQPEAYISNVTKILDEKGDVTVEATVAFLQSYMDAFCKWVNLVGAK